MRKRTYLLATLLVSSIVRTANGSLISQDLAAPGDGLVTYDSFTELYWLDLTETEFHSYDDVLAGYGGFTTSLGFRYATGNELAQLIADAGVSEGYSTSWDVTDINNTARLISLFGIEWTDGYNYVDFGYNADVNSLGQRGQAVFSKTDQGTYSTWSSLFFDGNPYQPYIGSFLVRDANSALPEPATTWLIGSALVGLVALCRGKSLSGG